MSDVTWTSLGWDARRGDGLRPEHWKRLKKAHGGGDDADFQEAGCRHVGAPGRGRRRRRLASVAPSSPLAPTKTGFPFVTAAGARPALAPSRPCLLSPPRRPSPSVPVGVARAPAPSPSMRLRAHFSTRWQLHSPGCAAHARAPGPRMPCARNRGSPPLHPSSSPKYRASAPPHQPGSGSR